MPKAPVLEKAKEKITIPLSEIQIPPVFTQSVPRRGKVEQKKAYIQQYGTMEKPLIIHPQTHQLIDGWASYLAAKELGKEIVEVVYGTQKRSQPSPLKTKKPRPKNPSAKVILSEEVKQAVWEAEDGRCESCKRPMDRKAAQFRRVDPTQSDWRPENLHLVCLDCKNGKPDPLYDLSVPKEVVQELAERIGLSGEETVDLVQNLLCQNGVILRENKGASGKPYRLYWLPGIAVFLVDVQSVPRVMKVIPDLSRATSESETASQDTWPS